MFYKEFQTIYVYNFGNLNSKNENVKKTDLVCDFMLIL